MKNLSMLPMAAFLTIAAASCGSKSQDTELTASGLNPENFKAVVNGDSTDLYILKNAAGMEACITNYGGRIVSLAVPDREGTLRDVVLGFDSVQAYFPENNLSDFGAAIGRYANRIKNGQIVIDADTFQLPQNNFGHCLHGGTDMGTLGWQYRVYKASQPNDSTLVLTIKDADGNNGFPGEVDATVTYTLTADNALDIAYSATTSKPTVINLTNHSYFNLVETLQLREGEIFRKQIEGHRRCGEVKLHHAARFGYHLRVVESERRKLVDRHPASAVILSRGKDIFSDIYQCAVGYRYNSFARVSLHFAESTYLLHVDVGKAGQFGEHALRGVVDAFVVSDETSHKRPLTHFRLEFTLCE